MQRGSVVIVEEKREVLPQTSAGGSMSRVGRRAPPRTPFRKRKVGDKVRLPDNSVGVIRKIRANGHESYLVGLRWFSESEVK